MSWTSGEILTAARLEDKNDRSVASGYIGLKNEIIDGSIFMPGFNLLKIANSSNIFKYVTQSSGTITHSNSDGTMTLTVTTGKTGSDFLPHASSVSISENDVAGLFTTPRICTFKFDDIFISGSTALNYAANTGIRAIIGLLDTTPPPANSIAIETAYEHGEHWVFRTKVTLGATSSSIDAPLKGDIFTIYATDTKAILLKNNNVIAIHTTSLPQGTGRGAYLSQNSGNYSAYIKLSWLS